MNNEISWYALGHSMPLSFPLLKTKYNFWRNKMECKHSLRYESLSR